ncbi:MAG: type II toxin-antitoxin system RelE/ParE family toxin [Propionibacteriaceae bacterium]|nr:type II toxin-antitoxin system RelE/ParE family toxin [Propionibacteriaceae bacterium]
MTRYRLSHTAVADIDAILLRSGRHFGEPARRRYAALIAAGIRDVAKNPSGADTRSRPELGDGVRSYHLRQSRAHTTGGAVHEPRHFLIYRVDAGDVVIGRVLHESMDLERHIDSASTWES